jgi:hypothetical protein
MTRLMLLLLKVLCVQLWAKNELFKLLSHKFPLASMPIVVSVVARASRVNLGTFRYRAADVRDILSDDVTMNERKAIYSCKDRQ